MNSYNDSLFCKGNYPARRKCSSPLMQCACSQVDKHGGA